MGTRDDKPWDNDTAADWFGDLFDAIKLREKVRQTLELDVEDHHEEIRAAASLLMFLGRTYVWPIDHIDDDLQLAITKLEAMASMPDAEDLVPVEAVTAEVALLRSRLKDASGANETLVSAAWNALRT
jgi:hypothetical protein